MSEINDWNVSAASNNSAAPDGAPETTMTINQVNNTMREMMAVPARWDKDTNGSLSTAGTSTVYTVASPNRTISAYYDGLTFVLDFHVACGASPTLNVSAVGADALVWPDGTALVASDIPINAKVLVVHDGTNWQVLSVGGPAARLDKTNTFAASQTILGGDLTVEHADTTNAILNLKAADKTPGNFIARVNYTGHDDADADVLYGSMITSVGVATAGNETGIIKLAPIQDGTENQFALVVQKGVHLDSPTGGDPGVGKINTKGYEINGAALRPILQYDNTDTQAVATIATNTPFDDTIPDNTEGGQVLSLSFTPKVATSTLLIRFTGLLSAAGTDQVTIALFTDASASSIAVTSERMDSVDTILTGKLDHEMASPGTSAVVFSIRIGAVSNNVTINGIAGARSYGGVAQTILSITEIAA